MTVNDFSSSVSNTEYIPKEIAHFDVVRKIGEGGMGVVYLAKDKRSAGLVALKVLSRAQWARVGAQLAPHIREDIRREIERRFRAEPFILSSVQHPGLVACYDAGTTSDGEHFLAMEYVPGDNLHKYIHRVFLVPSDPKAARRVRRQRRSEIARLGHQLAQTLLALHAAGVVHRDVKPDNVLVVYDPFALKNHRVKLLDVGIAKLPPGIFAAGGMANFTIQNTAMPAVLGTPFYMAPEQWGNAATATASADVYALGMTLYECLCGMDPDSRPEPLPSLKECDPEIEPAWIELVRSMTIQDPAQRISMQSATNELQRLARVEQDVISETSKEFADAVLGWEKSGRTKLPEEEASIVRFRDWANHNSLTQGENEFIQTFERTIAERRLSAEREARANIEELQRGAQRAATIARYVAVVAFLMAVGAICAAVAAFRAETRAQAIIIERDRTVEELNKEIAAKKAAEKVRDSALLRVKEGTEEQAAALGALKSSDDSLDKILADPTLALGEKVKGIRGVIDELKKQVSKQVATGTTLKIQRDAAQKDKKEAEEARDKAQREKTEADLAATAAMNARDIALKQKVAAETERDTAKKDKKISDDAATEAKNQETAAKSAKIEAERQRDIARAEKKSAEDAAHARGVVDGKATCVTCPPCPACPPSPTVTPAPSPT